MRSTAINFHLHLYNNNINKRTQEQKQSDPHQAPNTKGKEPQNEQMASRVSNSSQNEWNSASQS